jgi:hypothetical protein
MLWRWEMEECGSEMSINRRKNKRKMWRNNSVRGK